MCQPSSASSRLQQQTCHARWMLNSLHQKEVACHLNEVCRPLSRAYSVGTVQRTSTSTPSLPFLDVMSGVTGTRSKGVWPTQVQVGEDCKRTVHSCPTFAPLLVYPFLPPTRRDHFHKAHRQKAGPYHMQMAETQRRTPDSCFQFLGSVSREQVNHPVQRRMQHSNLRHFFMYKITKSSLNRCFYSFSALSKPHIFVGNQNSECKYLYTHTYEKPKDTLV